MPKKQLLPYFRDSAKIFEHIAHDAWAVWLDSGFPHSQQGRYDILAADPVITLVTKDLVTTINDGASVRHSEDDPFYLLQHYLGSIQTDSADLPFNCGAIGYFSYDLGRRIEKLPSIASDGEAISQMSVGIYHWAIVVDHQLEQTWLVSRDIAQSKLDVLSKLFSTPANYESNSFEVLAEPK